MTSNVGLALVFSMFMLEPSVSPSQSTARQHADAVVVVKEFYSFHFRNKFDYSLRGLRLRRRWLAPNLYQLLTAELKRPSNADEVPDLDGDPFTDSQEPPATFRIGKTTGSGEKATIEVFLIWKEKRKVLEERKVEVDLGRSGNSWRITNIRANHADGDLLQFLKRDR
jgi:hypothetical protein